MDREELAPHVEEVARVLGEKADKDEILKDLETYLNQYRVTLDWAKRNIVKKMGGDPNALSGGGGRKTVATLTGSEQSVDLLVKVLTVNPKTIEVGGVSKNIIYGLVADETGKVPYTIWETEAVQMPEGATVLIHNAYTKEYKGAPQLNLGNRAAVEMSEEVLDVASMPSGSGGSREAKMSELAEGMNFVIVSGKVSRLESKEITASGEKKTIITGMLTDDTGSAEFTVWGDAKLIDGAEVRIVGAYVKSWRGVPKLNLGDRAEVQVLAKGALGDISSSVPKVRTLEDIEMAGGAMDAMVRGTLVDVREGSGLIMRCPDCRRVLQKGACRIHGKVKGVDDLRIKAILDDGTSSLNVVFGKELTEKLLGLNMEEAIKLTMEERNTELIKEMADEKLFARTLEIRGMVRSDDFGPMMIAKEVELFTKDVREEGAKLLTEMEGFN
jgi:replication factor A1